MLEAERDPTNLSKFLHRRHSIGFSSLALQHTPNESRWPRRVSFGDAEEAVLTWEEIAVVLEDTTTLGSLQALQQQAELARRLYETILLIKQNVEPWVDGKITDIEAIDDKYAQQCEDIQALYYQLTDSYQRVKHSAQETIAENRARVTEAIKDVEVLVARLEYEINALVSKVQDVEDGVATFENQVEDVERRAEDLKKQLETETWLHWAVRTLTGIGTGPNITRSR